MLIQFLLYTKWAHRDSNPEPTDYESAALTVELWAQISRKITFYAILIQPIQKNYGGQIILSHIRTYEYY